MVKLVSKKERLCHEVHGAKIYYRRISIEEKKRLAREATSRGRVDELELGSTILRAAVLGWEGVESEGEPVEYNQELVTLLPDEVIKELLGLIEAATYKQVEALGN